MKEMKMTTFLSAKKFGGSHVKKTLLVLALAALMVLAVAGSALAYSPVTSTGGIIKAGPGTPATGGANDVNAYVYMNWSNAAVVFGNTNGTDQSPHGNYTTTTAKCIVCHSVHDAAAGAPGATTGNADTLLRMKASQACGFCHVYTGGVVNGRPVYDGMYLPSAHDGINAAGVTVALANPGHYSSPDCAECHTSVHGVGADASVPAAVGFLLKTDMLANSNNRFTNPAATRTILGSLGIIGGNNGDAANLLKETGWTTAEWVAGAPANIAAQRKQMMGIFCAECHVGAYATSAANSATNVHNAAAGFNPSLSGHRVGANVTASNNWTSGGGSSSAKSGTGLTVAFAPASDCWSCHDAKDAFNNTTFPHSFGGSSFGLLSAANNTAGKTAIAEGNAKGAYPGPGSATGAGASVDVDGVCLKCHVSSNGTSGVGLSF